MKKTERILLICAMVIYMVGMLCMSVYTSPLWPKSMGIDSALFRLLGRGIVNGKTLYVDLFDHKGPILFYIEALGEYLGKFGVWGLQCVFGCATIFVLFSAGRKLVKQESIFYLCIPFLASLLVFFYTFESGNISEEYSLLFISISFLLFVNYHGLCKNGEVMDHPVEYAFYHGVCIGILAFIRLNNAISNCAGILVIGIILIREKKWKNLFANLLFGAIGVAVVTIPIMSYFAAIGSLSDMLYCTFTYNFLYAGNVGHAANSATSTMIWLLWYGPVIVTALTLLLGLIYRRFKFEVIDLILICVFLINLATMMVVNLNIHYFTLFVPVLFVVMCRYLEYSKKNIEIILVIALLLLFAFNDSYRFYSNFRRYYVTKEFQTKYDTIFDDFAIIPEEERDSVIGFNIPSAYYLCADIIPCYKYYTQQEWWAINNPDVLTDFFEWARNTDPKWILIPHQEENEEILSLLEENYRCVKSDAYVKMYRIKQ